MVYVKLGRYPIDITINTRMMGYWTTLVTGNNQNWHTLYINLYYPFYTLNQSGLNTLKQYYTGYMVQSKLTNMQNLETSN